MLGPFILILNRALYLDTSCGYRVIQMSMRNESSSDIKRYGAGQCPGMSPTFHYMSYTFYYMSPTFYYMSTMSDDMSTMSDDMSTISDDMSTMSDDMSTMSDDMIKTNFISDKIQIYQAIKSNFIR